MISLSLVFATLFFTSLGALVFIVIKKAPVLAKIPHESLQNQETFFVWVVRIAKTTFTALHPQRIKMYTVAQTARTLNIFRVLSFRMHRFVDAMAHTAKKKSQEMEHEHHLSSDARREEDDQRDESDTQDAK